MPVDDLAHGVQHRAVLQGQHLAAHEHGVVGEPAERQGAVQAVGLELDVVVEEEQVRGVGRLERLVHGPGEAAAAAEVALLDQVQAVAEPAGHLREAGVVADLLVPLVGHHDRR